MKKLLPLFVLGFLGFEIAVAQQAGMLDSTFDFDGKVTTSVSAVNDMLFSIAIQPDDKIVVGGASKINDSSICVLARYNTDGSLDFSFGTNGVSSIALPSIPGTQIRKIVLQNDGKIIGIVWTQNPNSTSDFIIIRYNNDGSLDNTFGTNGIATVNFYLGDIAFDVAITPSQEIYVGGWCGYVLGPPTDIAIARLDSNGNLDTTFNHTGKLIIDFGAGDVLFDIALQQDGKVILAANGSGGAFTSRLIRLEESGSLDTSFNHTGIASTNLLSSAALAIQPDGKIIAGGVASPTGSDNDFALARFNSDGSLDSTFQPIVQNLQYDNDAIGSVIVLPDGRIIGAGYAGFQANLASFNFAMACWNSDGSKDLSFGNNGVVKTDFNSDYDKAYGMVLQSDNKIVLAGTSITMGKYNFALARYFSGLVGIDELTELNKDVSIYPNPFTQSLTIQSHSAGKKEIILFDVTGKEILRQQTEEAEIKLNTVDIAAGFYLLKVGGENFKVVKGVEN